MTKKHDNSTFDNAADKATMADIEARRAAGEDVFGDMDDDATPAAAAAETPPVEADLDDEGKGDDAAAAAAAEGEGEGKGEGEGEGEGDGKTPPADAKPEGAETPPAKAAETPPAKTDAAPETPPAPREFKTPTQAEIDEQRKTLRTEKNDAFKKFSAGELSEDAYLAIENRVDDSLADLIGQRTLLVANEQNRINAQETKLEQIRVAGKKDGIDYSTADAADEFDAALRFVASIKANAALGFDAIADKAHSLVLAQRGIEAPKPAAAPAPAPAVARVPPKAPITLSGVPAAATPNGGGGVSEQLARLDGLDFQEAVGQMPKSQRDAWLDS